MSRPASRVSSTFIATDAKLTGTLADYITLYACGSKIDLLLHSKSLAFVRDSPFLQVLKKGFETLLLIDPIDEYAITQLEEFDGKKHVCMSKEGLDALGDKAEKVIILNRITDSPCVLVTGQFGSSSNMQRIMKA